MTRTIVASATREIVIGFDQPFCVIGERINPTGRKVLNEELERGDFSRVASDAIAQTEAGATVLDINSGAVFSNMMAQNPRYADNNFVEPMLMPKLIEFARGLMKFVPGKEGMANLQAWRDRTAARPSASS